MKIQIFNDSNRQFSLDTHGKGKHENIFLVGFGEKMVLEVDANQIKKITNDAPNGVQINILG
jgi:hypothetical protein